MDDQCLVGLSVGGDCQKSSAADVSAEVHAVCKLSFWHSLETGCTAVASEAKFCQLDSQHCKLRIESLGLSSPATLQKDSRELVRSCHTNYW